MNDEIYALCDRFSFLTYCNDAGHIEATSQDKARVYDCKKSFALASLSNSFSDVVGQSIKKPSAVYVVGPLIGGVSGWWFSTYDDLVASIEDQFKSTENDSVVMVIDSPGGSVMGLFDACNAILALKKKYNKPLVGYAYSATSAAYALGACCDHLVAGAHSDVASIGVIAKIVDRTKQNEQMGLRVEVVRSGSLKADPNPDVALTQASLDRVKSKIRAYASDFEAFIEKARGIKGALDWQGSTFYGQKALDLGLIDSIGSLQDAITKAMLLTQDSITTKDKRTMNETLKKLVGATDEAGCLERVAALVAIEKTFAEALKQVESLKLEVASIEAKTIKAFEAKLAGEAKAKEENQAKEALIASAINEGRLTQAHLSEESYKGFLLSLPVDRLGAHLSVLPKLVATSELQPAKPSQAPQAKASVAKSTNEFSVEALASKFAIDQKYIDQAKAKQPTHNQEDILKGLCYDRIVSIDYAQAKR